MSMETLINSTLPKFKAQAYHNDDFISVTDEDLRGKWSILFFYPADFTFVCPTELGDMAERFTRLLATGLVARPA